MKDLNTSTNGLLKRFIALNVVKWSNWWSFVLLLIPVALLIINGLDWISISIESISTILVGTNSLIGIIQTHKSQIVNFYFERDNNELETTKPKPQPCDENKV